MFLTFKRYAMALFHHPVFQSLLFPLLLGLCLSGLLRPTQGRWWGMVPAFSLMLSLAVWPGFVWPALTHVHMLIWMALSVTVTVTLLMAFGLTGNTGVTGRTGFWASLVLVLLGLAMAGWGATGGSMLLAQLALMLSTVAAVAAWQTRRAIASSWWGLLPLLVFAAGVALSLGVLPTSGSSVGSDDDLYQFTR